MPFPTTPVLDNFTGTNGTDLPVYSANWAKTNTDWSDLEIQGNAATGIDVAGTNVDHWTTNFGPNSEAYVTISTIDLAFVDYGVTARLQGEGGAGTVDGYLLIIFDPATLAEVRYYRLDNAALTQLGASISQAFSNGDALGLEIIGSTLQAYRQPSGGSWAALGTSRSDATYGAAGKIGLWAELSTTVRLDAFGGGTVVAAAHPGWYVSSGGWF